MSERRYRVRCPDRSPSPRRPRPRSRHFSPSRPRNSLSYIPRGREEYSGGPGTSRRIEKRDHFNRDVSPHATRALEYGNRDRSRYWAGDRRHRSPPRVRSPRKFEKRDRFERDNNTLRNMRRLDYDDAAGEAYKDGAHIGHPMRSYDEGSYQWDCLLDDPGKFDHLSVNDYGGPRDYNRVREKDYYPQYNDKIMRAFALGNDGIDDVRARGYLSNAGVSSNRFSVSSCYLNTNTDKRAYSHLDDKRQLKKSDGGLCDEENRLCEKKANFSLYRDGFLGVDKRAGEENYCFKNGNSLMSSHGHMKGDYTHPREYVSASSCIMKEGFRGYSPSRDRDMPSKLSPRGSELTSQLIGFDGYTGSQFDNTRSSARFCRLPPEKQDNGFSSEFGRSNISSTSTRLNDAGEDYRDHHVSKNAAFNPAVDECLHKKQMKDDGQWVPFSFSQVQLMPDDKLDASRSLQARKQRLDMLGVGSSHLNGEIDLDYGNVGKDNHRHHHSGADGGEWSHDKRSDILQSREYMSYDPPFSGFYASPRKNLNLVGVNLDEPFERRLRNKYARDEILYEQDVKIRIAADGSGARNIYYGENSGGEIGLQFSEKPRSCRANYEESWRGISNVANGLRNSSRFHPGKPGSGDIKRRLGPVPNKLHVSQRLVKKYKQSIMKRLKPAPTKQHGPVTWVKNLNFSKFPKHLQELDGSPRDREGNHLGNHIPHVKSEPPEESEDFKQLVQSAFFKYLKRINEMPAKRMYLEHEKAGSLKCVVCGSDSDEFAETESLARHAIMSEKVGLRSQHLGLHRALCALMGWKTSEQLSSEWHCEVISDAESSALNEDIIIWPPVVVVYNSTMDNKNLDERVVVFPEKLDMELRDMGFKSIVKVCNGKPANQSVMLVKFNSTLSGLQEADRYHQQYLESNHGRAGLNQLKSEHQMPAQVTSTNREKDFLYGHLGTAKDLNKLDFDTKKRCVLRSKLEILSIVNMPLAIEGVN